MRKVSILGTRGIPASHGGFETFAEHLALYLTARGWIVTVFCQSDGTLDVSEDDWSGVRRLHIPVRDPGPLGTMEFDWKSIQIASREEGVVLTLGYNTALFCLRLRLKGKINVINMDGIEWRRDKWSPAAKAWFWINELAASILGNVLIADHPQIAQHLTRPGTVHKLVTIAYGSNGIESGDESLLQPFQVQPGSYALVIARMEPENSVLEIVRAWSRLERGAKLVVLGQVDSSRDYHRRVLGAASHEVLFPGAIYEARVVAALRFFARCYVHGHRVGGTNPSLVEAMGASCAVIAHDNPFNRWVAGAGGIFFDSEDACAAAIDIVLRNDALVNTLKLASRTRRDQAFTWEAILGQYESLLTPLAKRTL